MRVVPVSAVPPSDSARGSRKEKPPVVSITIDREEDSEDGNSSSVYCSLPHSSTAASSSSSPRRGWCRRLLYAYPRLCLAVVLLGTSVGTGAYSAYHLAQWTLHLTGARHALSVARTQLVATEITLRSVAACGVSQVPSRAVAVRARIEQGVAPWNETLDAYAARVDSVKTNVTWCASRDRERLERVLAPNASTAPAARACLMDALEKTLARYTATPSTSWHVGLRRFQKLVETRKTLADMSWTRQNDTATVLALAANASSDLAAIVTTSLDELESIVATSLKALAIPEIHVPDMPVSAALETFLGVTPIGAGGEKTPLSLVTGKQLLKTLRGIAGVDASLRLALDVLETSFSEIIVLVKKLDEQATKVREEVTEIRTTLQVHATESLARFRNATATLKHAVAVQTRATVDAFASTAIDLLHGNRSRDLDDQVWKVLSRWEDDDGEQERIPRDALVDPTRAPWRDRVTSPVHVTFDALEEALARGPDKGVVEQDAHYDKAVVRASLYDVSAVLVTIILTWDFLTRLGWFLGRLIRLLTESYSDLDPVDIRDNGSISTLIDVWGVLKCRHDLLTVLDAILTEGSYVVQTAVHFVLWVLFEIAGTLGLVAWHEAIADRCRPHSGQIDSSAATPAALVTYIRAWFGGGSVQALSPMAAVHKQMARFDKAFDADEKAWRKRVHAAARVQSAVMDGLLLQRRFLLDVRENLARCGIEDVLLEDGEELSWCSTMPIERAESISAWESSAADAFHHERLEANFDAGSILVACVARGRALTSPPDQLVGRLDHAHGCLLDQTLYLGAAGWWMVVVVLLALRLVSRMVTKAAGMVFWRYLSADRVEVLAFSDESGAIQAREQLPKAIRRHLRNIRWRVTARAVGVALGISSVVVVGVHVLPPSAMEPIL